MGGQLSGQKPRRREADGEHRHHTPDEGGAMGGRDVLINTIDALTMLAHAKTVTV